MLSRDLVLRELFPFREIWNYFMWLCREVEGVWEWPVLSAKSPFICAGSFPPKAPGRCLGIPPSCSEESSKSKNGKL